MSNVFHKLATDPRAFMRFKTTGQLPREHKPSGPLYDLMKAISSRDLQYLEGVTIGASLGYTGSRMFRYGSQAFQWIAPSGSHYQPWPSESWKNRRRTQRLYIEDLLECCVKVPEGFAQRYPHLRRPSAMVDNAPKT